MLLGVNIDHIATLRNARGGNEPDVFTAAQVCINAGANGITTHLREDRRHIKDFDVFNIRQNLKCRLNLEMAATEEMQEIALKLKPDACCIVPERRQELTTEGGLNAAERTDYLTSFIKPLTDNGIEVSLFITPDENQVTAAAKTGAQFIELHTGAFSAAFGSENEISEFNRLYNAANLAISLGLKVNAGHGLNYQNVSAMKKINCLHELNIGHSIISKAVFSGLDNAVKEMLKLI